MNELELMRKCSGDCDYCEHKRTVAGTDERIDREPAYYCGLFADYFKKEERKKNE